jgi:sensor c-di-GMP phosphodiesterase-like protein
VTGDSLIGAAASPDELIAIVDREILGGTMSENTKQVIKRQLVDMGDPAQARALAVGLALGGPEFQRQ